MRLQWTLYMEIARHIAEQDGGEAVVNSVREPDAVVSEHLRALYNDRWIEMTSKGEEAANPFGYSHRQPRDTWEAWRLAGDGLAALEFYSNPKVQTRVLERMILAEFESLPPFKMYELLNNTADELLGL